MTELDQAMAAAFASEGKQDDVNKVYLTLIRTLFYLPVKKEQQSTPDQPFSPLFAEIDQQFFIIAFDSVERLRHWAGSAFDEMNYVGLTGRELIAGLGDTVYLGINIGTEFYKEFSPDEIKRLKSLVARIEKLKP